MSHVTLSRRLKEATSQRNSHPNSQNLTFLEEGTIVERILDLDSQSFSSRLRDVKDMANKLHADQAAPYVSFNWASTFAKQQPQLKTCFFANITIRKLNANIQMR